MGIWIDGLNLVQDNIPDVLRQFYNEFRAQYYNSQQVQKAQQKLDTLKMVDRDIDTYSANFEDLCQLARYTVGNEETVYTYIQGLLQGC